jgi:hypothetical protein
MFEAVTTVFDPCFNLKVNSSAVFRFVAERVSFEGLSRRICPLPKVELPRSARGPLVGVGVGIEVGVGDEVGPLVGVGVETGIIPKLTTVFGGRIFDTLFGVVILKPEGTVRVTVYCELLRLDME